MEKMQLQNSAIQNGSQIFQRHHLQGEKSHPENKTQRKRIKKAGSQQKDYKMAESAKKNRKQTSFA